ncbi:pseudaminic acid biosynthesis-associated methylase [Desulfobacter hydrogenophilus]|uniref:Pseudaminic acid biosynthesis-associated methylase n=1 Tax=Desulfobacter hydrogenophilus TaxID=2291 RepID=A0A328FBQ9_9BACT|nr:pseudaminic acid biosynthesis-associated methylase [Desulfobacter hydrogenophilus]NDY73271.1 pseudaminic acid biosynthesis-associated methylase [Desulfobacter hydrogenophilus]QBH13847.1 pseudaminic acid biosynthesis-associated methylase [Desulfobacter hydrogenophilus]RAM00862.1 pseudaminic acid biosynthesis-associated methylase [Desulfobacter hydrogenophilus]
MSFKTEQEKSWAGEFGTQYIKSHALLSSNLYFFPGRYRSAHGVKTCIKFGANIGMNLKALKLLFPEQEKYGIEINSDAVGELVKNIPPNHVCHSSILDFPPPNTHKMIWDLALIKGVLIHINPDELNLVYDKLVTACEKYLLVAEYFNPTPVAIPYRGHVDRLFKREFAGEIMDRYPCMKLLDYGFVYRRDPHFPQDDISWFLMEKRL